MTATRREFLQQTITTAVGLCARATFAVQRADASPPQAMPLRKLGRTGIEISLIGMGLAPLGLGGYSPDEFEATTNAAIAAGINYFDVQPNYGKAESYFAPVLRRHRDRIFIVTKTWETTRDGALRSLTASLEHLQSRASMQSSSIISASMTSTSYSSPTVRWLHSRNYAVGGRRAF